MTPDLLRNRSQSLELTNGEESDPKQAILNILKDGCVQCTKTSPNLTMTFITQTEFMT